MPVVEPKGCLPLAAIQVLGLCDRDIIGRLDLIFKLTADGRQP